MEKRYCRKKHNNPGFNVGDENRSHRILRNLAHAYPNTTTNSPTPVTPVLKTRSVHLHLPQCHSASALITVQLHLPQCVSASAFATVHLHLPQRHSASALTTVDKRVCASTQYLSTPALENKSAEFNSTPVTILSPSA